MTDNVYMSPGVDCCRICRNTEDLGYYDGYYCKDQECIRLAHLLSGGEFIWAVVETFKTGMSMMEFYKDELDARSHADRLTAEGNPRVSRFKAVQLFLNGDEPQ